MIRRSGAGAMVDSDPPMTEPSYHVIVIRTSQSIESIVRDLVRNDHGIDLEFVG